MSTLIRIVSVLLWFNAVGFGVCCLPGIRNLLTGREIPYILGFPAYGHGPFERIGVKTTVPLLLAFLIVCAMEALAGYLLWGGHRSGAILAFAFLPAGAVFWWGFALPIPWLFATVWTILIILGWRSLH